MRETKTPLKTAKPNLIAIVGGSGAGKTWLSDQLEKAFGKSAARLSLDNFYRDRSHLTAKQRSAINFDHPRAIDWKHVEHVLNKISKGHSARAPRYDFTTHTRVAKEELMKPKPFIIMDGLWLLRRPAVRKLFSCRIFIDCPRSLRFQRRMRRDLLERGRKQTTVKKQFTEQVEPMHHRFVSPHLRSANIVLRNPSESEVIQLAEKIKDLLKFN